MNVILGTGIIQRKKFVKVLARNNIVNVRFYKNAFFCIPDINECLEGTAECEVGEHCINTRGDYRCEKIKACGLGYKFSPITGKCEDFNECKELESICARGTTCVNNVGSYKCVGDPASRTV